MVVQNAAKVFVHCIYRWSHGSEALLQNRISCSTWGFLATNVLYKLPIVQRRSCTPELVFVNYNTLLNCILNCGLQSFGTFSSISKDPLQHLRFKFVSPLQWNKAERTAAPLYGSTDVFSRLFSRYLERLFRPSLFVSVLIERPFVGRKKQGYSQHLS